MISLESRRQASPARLVLGTAWPRRQLGSNASSHLERHDARLRRQLGSSWTFTNLVPAGPSVLDLLVPVPAEWARAIAASPRHETRAGRDASTGSVLRGQFELEDLIPGKLGNPPYRWRRHQCFKLSSSQGHRWFVAARPNWFQAAWFDEVRWSSYELGIKPCQAP